MTVTYRTVVLHLPPTPLGLLGERWAVEHWCNGCRQRVSSDQLVAHARSHENIDAALAGGSFPSGPTPSRMTSDVIEPNTTEEVGRG